MTNKLRKTIMDKSRLQNKYPKYLSRENFVNRKKMKINTTLFAENPK